MLEIIADTHTHTVACGHAYSTLSENMAAAARKGLKAVAMTEHGVAMADGPRSLMYFGNLRTLPRKINGVLLLKGAEVNIMDYEGGVDIPQDMLRRLDWVIASLHSQTIKPGTVKEHTKAWMQVAQNPDIDVIGHCGDERFAFDYEAVIKEFARCGKIVEINSHSFEARPGSEINCPKIAGLCAEHGVPVVVSSDAHFCEDVGQFDQAIAMLERIQFPHELILNADYHRFVEAIRKVTGKNLTDED